MHEDLTDPAKQATSTRMPTAQDFADFQAAYQRLSPHPEHFMDFLTSLSQNQADPQGWSDAQLAAMTAPTLIVLGDHDFVTIEHAALMQHLIPGAQLAVLSGHHAHAGHPPGRAVAAHAGPVPGLSIPAGRRPDDER